MRKRYLVFTLLSLALLGTAFTGRRTLTFLHTEEFIVDTAQSSIEWVGKKKIKQHYGNVKISRGSLQSNHGTLTGGDFEIDMQSISNLDIKDDKSRARLIKHLRSPDFFSVDSFPSATLLITRIATYSGPDDNTHTLTGSLKIKGITNEIVFPAKISQEPGKISAEAYFEIDRTKWNVRYGSKTFFNDLGDDFISDMIGFKVSVLAKPAR